MGFVFVAYRAAGHVVAYCTCGAMLHVLARAPKQSSGATSRAAESTPNTAACFKEHLLPVIALAATGQTVKVKEQGRMNE